jgi:hypothetical protein
MTVEKAAPPPANEEVTHRREEEEIAEERRVSGEQLRVKSLLREVLSKLQR